MPTTLTHRGFLGLPLAALCTLAAAAPQAPQPQPSSQPAQAQQPAGALGLTVVRDADTGQLRAPTPAEMRALRAQAPATGARPVQPTMQVGPDGRRSVQLGDSRLVYSVVTRAADGKLDQHCAHGQEAAERLLNRAAPATSQGERHERR